MKAQSTQTQTPLELALFIDRELGRYVDDHVHAGPVLQETRLKSAKLVQLLRKQERE